jgi:hypothetical protein
MGLMDVFRFKSTLFAINQDFVSARFAVRSTRRELKTEKKLESEILEEEEVARLRKDNQKRISETSRLLGKMDVSDVRSLKEEVTKLSKTLQLEKMTVTELKTYGKSLHRQVQLIAKIIENLHQLVLREDLEVVHDTRVPLEAIKHFANQLKKVVPKMLRRSLSSSAKNEVKKIIEGLGEELNKLVGEVLSFTEKDLSFYQRKSTKGTLAQHLRERTTFKKKINGKVQWILSQIKELEKRLYKEFKGKKLDNLQQALLNELAYFRQQFEELVKFSILRVQIAEFMIIEAMKKKEELAKELMGLRKEIEEFSALVNIQKTTMVGRTKHQNKKDWYQSRAEAFSKNKLAIDATVKKLNKKVKLEGKTLSVALKVTNKNLVAELNAELKREEKIRKEEYKAQKKVSGNVGSLMLRGKKILMTSMFVVLGLGALKGDSKMSIQSVRQVEETAIEETMSAEDVKRLRQSPKLAAEFASRIGAIIEDKGAQAAGTVEKLAVGVARGIKAELTAAEKTAARKATTQKRVAEQEVKKTADETLEEAAKPRAGAGKIVVDGPGFVVQKKGSEFLFSFSKAKVVVDLSEYKDLIALKSEALKKTTFKGYPIKVRENLTIKSLSENSEVRVVVEGQTLEFYCKDVIIVDGPTTMECKFGNDTIAVKATGKPDLDYAGEDLIKYVHYGTDTVILMDDNYLPDAPILNQRFARKGPVTDKDFLEVLDTLVDYPVYWGPPGIGDSDHHNIVCNGLMRNMYLAMIGDKFLNDVKMKGLSRPIDMRRNWKWQEYFIKSKVAHKVEGDRKLPKIKIVSKGGRVKKVRSVFLKDFGTHLKKIGTKPHPGMVITLKHLKSNGKISQHSVVVGEVKGYKILNVYSAESDKESGITGKRGKGMGIVKQVNLSEFDGYWVTFFVDSHQYLRQMGVGAKEYASR